MKAIIQSEYGDIDVLRKGDLPVPKYGREDVLVEVQAVGLNPVDVKMRIGIFPGDFPLILGVDFSGTVAKKGDLVRDFEVGDRVFGMVPPQAPNGSYAEFVSVPYQMIAKIPKRMPYEAAAAVPVAYMTAFQAALGHGALQENCPLFIAGGGGGVGSAAISLIKAHRGGPIFTLAGSDASESYLETQLGIPKKQIVRYQGLSIEETAKKLIEKNGKERFYMALDFVGSKAKELCFEVVGPGGHLATVLPEDEHFPISIWGRGEGPMWKKSLSLHMVYLFAAAESENRKDWMFYKTILTQLAKLFEAKEIPYPLYEVVGDLTVETAKKAHLALEEKHTKGKLVMSAAHSKE